MIRFFLIFLIFVFYIFFFLRAYLLSNRLKTKIKADNILVNSSIFFAGLSSVIFLTYILFPKTGDLFFTLNSLEILKITGTVLISLGLIISISASLNMKESWRIGIKEGEKTELITTGFYAVSRNPYFLAYDFVLIGMVLNMLSPILIFTSLITIILFHLMILKEEKYLEKTHKEKYLEYKKRVGRYL